MSATPLVTTERHGAVAVLTLERPDRRNALNHALIREAMAALDAAAADLSLRALVLRGQGGHFCSGFDIQAMGDPADPAGSRGPEEDRSLLASLLDRVRTLRVPVVAALAGSAVGAGLDLAACCDFRVAEESCRLGITPARLGVVYSPAGIARFLALAGPGGARELFLLGRLVTARRALEMGLVHAVVPDGAGFAQALALAGTLAENAPLAVEAMKWIITRLEAGLALSAEDAATAGALAGQAYRSADRAEARRAFAEKRAPVFRRR